MTTVPQTKLLNEWSFQTLTQKELKLPDIWGKNICTCWNSKGIYRGSRTFCTNHEFHLTWQLKGGSKDRPECTRSQLSSEVCPHYSLNTLFNFQGRNLSKSNALKITTNGTSVTSLGSFQVDLIGNVMWLSWYEDLRSRVLKTATTCISLSMWVVGSKHGSSHAKCVAGSEAKNYTYKRGKKGNSTIMTGAQSEQG